MVVYFDLENLNSFLQQPKNEFHSDCLKLLKKQLDITFNFSKDEFKKSEDLMNFIKIFGDGIGDKQIKYISEKFPARSLKSNSHKDFTKEQLLSVYFINCDDLEKLQSKDDLLIADIGEEMDVFKKLFLYNEDYKFEKKLRIGSQFQSWSDLSKYQTPFTDIIIVDNFILSDKGLYETNFKGIIKNCLKEGVRKKINIVIFLKPDQEHVPFEDMKSEIKKLVAERYTDNPNITIVKHYVEHDRTILKNCVRVYSGDTFNYFLSNGVKTTKGKEIHFSSIADKENYNLYIAMIDDLQKIISNSKSENIVGDKVSRFFTFS